MRKPNAWYEGLCAQLHASLDQIWQGLEASGFQSYKSCSALYEPRPAQERDVAQHARCFTSRDQHKSVMSRSTLDARLAELVQLKKLDRVGPRTYQLSAEPSSEGMP